MRFTSLTVILCVGGWLTAADVELPPAALSALEKMDKIESKLTADYKKSVIAQRNKTINELEKVVKDTTKSGNLELALAVKKKMDELIAKNEADEDTDLLGNKKPTKLDPAKLLVGMWDYQKTNTVVGTIEFMPSGNFTATITAPVKYPYIPGKWEIKEELVVLTWMGKAENVDTLTFTAVDKMSGDTHDLGKNSFTATKQAAK